MAEFQNWSKNLGQLTTNPHCVGQAYVGTSSLVFQQEGQEIKKNVKNMMEVP